MADQAAIDTTDPNTEMYLDALSIAWEDGELTVEGKIMLEGLQERLQITRANHDQLQVMVFENLAKLATNENKHQDALEWYERICEHNPNIEEAWRQRGLLLGKLGRDSEAIQCFQVASRIAAGEVITVAKEEIPTAVSVEVPAAEAEAAAAAKAKAKAVTSAQVKTIWEFPCPKCSSPIQVEEWEFPLRIECEACGVKGTLKNPPKSFEEKTITIAPEGVPAAAAAGAQAAVEEAETEEGAGAEAGLSPEVQAQMEKILALKQKLDLALEMGKVTQDVYDQKVAQINAKLAELEGAEAAGIPAEEGAEAVAEEGATSAEEEPEPVSIIKCPKCKGDLPIYSNDRPLKIQCPNCGAKGTLK